MPAEKLPNSDRYSALETGVKIERKKIYSSLYYLLIIKQNIMEKKILKWYEAPACEVIETELEGFLCGSGDIEGVEDPSDLNGGNDDPGF